MRHLGCYLRSLCFCLTWHDCIGWDPLGLGKKDLETLKLKEVYASSENAQVIAKREVQEQALSERLHEFVHVQFVHNTH